MARPDPTADTVDRIQSALKGQGDYFRNTKILTRFASIASGTALVIIYSETAENDAVKSFFTTIPREIASRLKIH